MPGTQQQLSRRGWAGLTPLSRLRDELDELFDRFRGDEEGDGSSTSMVEPPMDLKETDGTLQRSAATTSPN